MQSMLSNPEIAPYLQDNLVTQRALVHRNASMEWLDGNLGSKLTMKYPSCFLMGEGAHGEILSIAYAGDGQHHAQHPHGIVAGRGR